MLIPVQPDVVKSGFTGILDRVVSIGTDNIIFGFFPLEHQPHSFDIVLGIAPITHGVQVSEMNLTFKIDEGFPELIYGRIYDPQLNAGDTHADLAGDEVKRIPPQTNMP